MSPRFENIMSFVKGHQLFAFVLGQERISYIKNSVYVTKHYFYVAFRFKKNCVHIPPHSYREFCLTSHVQQYEYTWILIDVPIPSTKWG